MRRTGKTVLNELLEPLMVNLADLPDTDLKLLIRRVKQHSRINCWYVAYEVGPFLAQNAKWILKARAAERKANRKAEPRT